MRVDEKGLSALMKLYQQWFRSSLWKLMMKCVAKWGHLLLSSRPRIETNSWNPERWLICTVWSLSVWLFRKSNHHMYIVSCTIVQVRVLSICSIHSTCVKQNPTVVAYSTNHYGPHLWMKGSCRVARIGCAFMEMNLHFRMVCTIRTPFEARLYLLYILYYYTVGQRCHTKGVYIHTGYPQIFCDGRIQHGYSGWSYHGILRLRRTSWLMNLLLNGNCMPWNDVAHRKPS